MFVSLHHQTLASVSRALALLTIASCSHDVAQPVVDAGLKTRSAVALGERITSPSVPIADIARDPRRFEGQSFATSGKVTAVCQEAGCWMEIGDDSAQAHVRMHGHSFFVPKTAAGRIARVQATIVPQRGGGHDDCEGRGVTQLELDATGVELD